MAATPIYVKNLKKIFSRTKRPLILKLGMQHQWIKLYINYINDEPGLTLTYFMARPNLVAYAFELGKLLQSHLMVKTCSKWLNWQKIYVFEENLTSGGCLPLPWGYIIYMTIIFKHLLHRNSMVNQSQILCGAFLEGGASDLINMVLVTWPRWPPCPYNYMVKILKNLYHEYLRSYDLETWHQAFGTQALQSLCKWWHWVDLGPYIYIRWALTGPLVLWFSSPEPLGSQGKLIVYPWSCFHLSVRRSSTILKVLLLWNQWSNQSQISCEASLGRGNKSLYKWSRSHDQDGHHAHIW